MKITYVKLTPMKWSFVLDTFYISYAYSRNESAVVYVGTSPRCSEELIRQNTMGFRSSIASEFTCHHEVLQEPTKGCRYIGPRLGSVLD